MFDANCPEPVREMKIVLTIDDEFQLFSDSYELLCKHRLHAYCELSRGVVIRPGGIVVWA